MERFTLNLIHYGHSRFIPEKFEPITCRQWIKPKGGFWASPVDSKFGWKDWCEAESWGTDSLKRSFAFKFIGNVVVIDSAKDLDKLPWEERDSSYSYTDEYIDFPALLNQGVDAVFLTEKGQSETRFSRPRDLYGWDCESVLILNPVGINL